MHRKFVVPLFLLIAAMSPIYRVFSYEMISGDPKNVYSDPTNPNDAQAVAKILFDEKKADIREMKTLYFFRQQNYDQRKKVDEEFKKLNNGQSLIPEDHRLFVETTMRDLIFAMLRGPMETKMRYLKTLVCDAPNEGYAKIVIEILVVEDTNRITFLQEFQKVPPPMLYEDCIRQHFKGDYLNFLEELGCRAREPDIDNPNPVDVQGAAEDLKKERQGKEIFLKGWNYKRSVLDDQLMSKPRKFAQAVLAEYFNCNDNHELRNDIPTKLSDQNLILGYQSLIDYIKDPYKYIATCIHDSVLDIGADIRATLILFVVGYSESPELAKIDQAFKDLYDNKNIATFLENVCLNDMVCDTVRALLS